MRAKNGLDVVRQAATVLGVLFQIGGGALAGVSVGRVSAENSTLVVPADYAFFVVWGPIYALSLAYTVYQALQGQRQNPLLRRVGWFVAGAFAGNGLWQILFPAELFMASQVLFVGVAACAVAALVGLVRYHRERSLDAAERWLVALPVGMLSGRVTAAVFVVVATTLVGIGVLDGGAVEAVLGAILLTVAAAVASVVVRSSKRGPHRATPPTGGRPLGPGRGCRQPVRSLPDYDPHRGPRRGFRRPRPRRPAADAKAPRRHESRSVSVIRAGGPHTRLVFPTLEAGKDNVVLVGFEWWQQELIDSWVPSLEGLAGRRPGLRFYELVAVPQLRLPARRIIDGGMETGIPDRKVRARTLTAYTELGGLLVALDLGGTQDIAVFLPDREGRISWRAAGAHDAARQAALEGALGLGRTVGRSGVDGTAAASVTT